jgi:hypothetical protein
MSLARTSQLVHDAAMAAPQNGATAEFLDAEAGKFEILTRAKEI